MVSEPQQAHREKVQTFGRKRDKEKRGEQTTTGVPTSSLDDERNEDFTARGIIVELVPVPRVMGVAPAGEVHASEEGECEGLERPASDRPTRPLQSFAPQVSSRDELEHVASGNLVAALAWLAQVTQDRVASDVGAHAEEKDQQAQDEVPLLHPLVRVVGVANQVGALHVTVE